MERGHCVVASLSHQIILYIHQIFYYLSLYFIIEELLLEFGQGVVCTVVVQVQGIQHIPEGEKSLIPMYLREVDVPPTSATL